MKSFLACIFAAVLMLAMAGCDSATETSNDTSSEVVTEAVTEETTAPAKTETVSYGDFDAQQKLSKSIQNGELLGATVEIEGTSEKVGTHYSIGQTKDGTFTGTTYEYSGEYPEDGAHVKFTGTVVGSGVLFTLEATSIEVIE